MTTSGLALPPSPAARRITTPSWRDGRLLIGVVLLLVSVVVGAKLLDGNDSLTPVLTASRDLSAGHVLVTDDLSTASVRLPAGEGGAYFSTAGRAALLGRALTRSVGRGELLPGSAIASGVAARTEEVSLSVAQGRHPVLHAGDGVDVYATTEAKGSAPGSDVCTTLVIGSNLEVVYDVATDSGASSDAVVLRVSPRLAPAIVHAGESASVDLVQLPADTTAATPTGTPPGTPPGTPTDAADAGAIASPPVTSLGSVPSGSCSTGK